MLRNNRTLCSLALTATLMPLLSCNSIDRRVVTDPPASSTTTDTPAQEFAIVKQVVDGDTIELDNGQFVRPLGYNTPEEGQPLYDEAAARLRELLPIGQTIKLERDGPERDVFGRLLRHIYLPTSTGEILASEVMLREGLGHYYRREETSKEEGRLKGAEHMAIIAGVGLWQPSRYRGIVGIEVHYNAKGEDDKNLNDEYITITTTEPIDMSGWRLYDASHQTYVLPQGTLLKPGERLRVHSGFGKDRKTTRKTKGGTSTILHHYWHGAKQTGVTTKGVFGNKGDRVFLAAMEPPDIRSTLEAKLTQRMVAAAEWGWYNGGGYTVSPIVLR